MCCDGLRGANSGGRCGLRCCGGREAVVPDDDDASNTLSQTPNRSLYLYKAPRYRASSHRCKTRAVLDSPQGLPYTDIPVGLCTIETLIAGITCHTNTAVRTVVETPPPVVAFLFGLEL